MEVMPHHAETSRTVPHTVGGALPCWGPEAGRHWREGLPVLRGLGLTLRELQRSDAPSLCAHLTTDQVSRFISPPPTSVEGFERFIAWTWRERAAGRYACFAVVPDGESNAVGIFQVRRLEDRDGVAEWGFILGEAYWGSGLFLAGAERVVGFAFGDMGLHRLEARASTANGRGNGALAKLGAVKELVLRQSFERHGSWHDQALWAILRDDWRDRPASPRRHTH
jgi:RimJ/RimL family protein N-acetyltransferase